MSQTANDVERERTIRLLTYLRELARLKTKVTRDLTAYDELLWFSDIPAYKGCFHILSPEADRTQDTIWLDIRKTLAPKKPPVPTSCAKWVSAESSEEPLAEPQLLDEISEPNASPPNISHLIDYPDVSEEWQRYKRNDWSPWADAYRNWRAADGLYFRLFSMHQQLKKLGEQYELLLGLGLLTWQTPDSQIVRRHVVVGNAILNFDSDRTRFEVQGAPEGIKLRIETDMIDPGRLQSAVQQHAIEALLEAVEESPWDKDEIDKVLRSWINSFSPDGVFSDSLRPPAECSKAPTLTYAPAIILRQRTKQNQIQFLNRIIAQINEGGVIPKGISDIVSDPADQNDDQRSHGATEEMGHIGDLYLPLLVNEEQKQIAHHIEGQRGILVQGPPGTGKSHTIANLVCHLLAQGKRVLITSQTPRALRVLKDKIPGDLAALCVTLLGDTQSAREELKASVQGINSKYSNWNPGSSKSVIARLEAHRYDVNKGLADTNRLLREQREIETFQHEAAFGAYTGTAQQIACRVRDEEDQFVWLRDAVDENQRCPMSNEELAELVALLRRFPQEYCLELRKDLVSHGTMPTVAQFVRLVNDEKMAQQNLETRKSAADTLRLNALDQIPNDQLRLLHESVSNLMVAIRNIKTRFAWTSEATKDVLSGNITSWKSLRDFMRSHIGNLANKVHTAQALKVDFRNTERGRLRTDAGDLVQHLENGGSLGWSVFAPQVVKRTRYIRKAVYLDGRPCRSPEQLKLLVTYLDAVEEIDALWGALKEKDRRQDGSLLLQVGYLNQRLESLEEVLKLADALSPAKERTRAARLAEPTWYNIAELENIILDISTAEYKHALDQVRSALDAVVQAVRVVQSSPRSHALNDSILAALEKRDTKGYGQCLDNLERLAVDQQALFRRDALLKRLRSGATTFCHSLETTPTDAVWDKRLHKLEAAWALRQADQWLIRFRIEHDPIKLEAELERLSTDERETTSKLAAEKAWDNCLRSLTPARRQNLIAWDQIMRRMPKTLTAKKRPKLLRQAQEYMDNCKGAIPAWVMPLYRVFETVTPGPEIFDVAIIDEASQTGPEGLILQYLAKRTIVVGDDQQISPEEGFYLQQDLDALVDRHLDGIPFKGLFGPGTSLFARSAIRFGSKIMLREHFRCMPEIIQFSNNLCYQESPLRPLRQYPPKRLEPIVVRHVENGFREGAAARALNRPEADELVETLVSMCSTTEYSGKTMGVISLQGETQAKYIESKLLGRLDAKELENRRIVCGDAYAFQGDERDVMFLTMVAAPNERIGAETGEADKRRFNVAASRAKDQLVLFHTATLSDLNPDSVRYRLLNYCLNYKSFRRTVADIDVDKIREKAQSSVRRPKDEPPPFQSWFEVDVFLSIFDHFFRVIPQFAVAGYAIDLVVEGTKGQLAVECDGDEWHGIEEYERDAARQRTLERCGWRFWRIRGHEYYRDPIGSLESLWKMLREMGIQPINSNSGESIDAPPGAINEEETGEVAARVDEGQAAVNSQPFLSPRSTRTGPTLPSAPDSGAVSDAARPTKVTGRDSQFDLIDFLARRRIVFKDKRSSGGAMWLIDGTELAPIVLELRAKGISFSYLPKGGKVSGHRSAWYSNRKT